ncbi:hypothetical protein [Pseudoalteromonas xiamenensis]
MDWMFVLPTSLFVFEKGLKKIGISSTKPEERAKALKWQSSYRSVVAMVGDDCNGWASSDGMNEMNLLPTRCTIQTHLMKVQIPVAQPTN